jgi:hypothetical protein
MPPQKLSEAFDYIRDTFFPNWDKNREWRIKEAGDAPFDGCAIPMTKSISIHSDLLDSDDLNGVIIHEICHAASTSSHGDQWQKHMQGAAERARKIGMNRLAEFIEKDILQARQNKKKASRMMP